MKHPDHVALLRAAQLPAGGTWADFGAGSGAFTLALRELVGPQAQIYAIDKDAGRLGELQREHARRFGSTASLHVIASDFARSLDLPPLDGALMANSLHYFRGEAGKLEVLRNVCSYMRSEAALLLVEYNVDAGNMWVPYPLSFETWQALAPRAGFSRPRLLATHPSSFLREFYSAVCYRVED